MTPVPFLEDIYPDNLLYAATIRSPVAKGLLKEIRVPDLPVGYTLITAKDIPGENRLDDTSIPVLADSNLNYIGEPVAILLGKDKTKLEELASRCDVITEEEKPVFDSRDSNAITEVKQEITIGNTDGYFQDINKVVAESYTTGIQEHWYAEPIGAITWFNNDNGQKTEVNERKPSGKGQKTKKKDNNTKSAEQREKKTEPVMVVRTATQWPSYVKRSVVRVLGVDPSYVSIEPTSLSLHMDGKLWYPSLIACHAAIGTYKTKKPVRLILTREEDFLYTPKRCKVDIDISTSINENGNLNAAEIDIVVNLGAYGVNKNEILDHVSLGSLGIYKFNNLKLTAKTRLTNIPPQGEFSGFGLAQGLYAVERHISRIAGVLGQDPADYRLSRTDTKTILPVSISTKNNVSGEELIKTVVKMSDYYRKWACNELLREKRGRKILESENPRGIGIAIGYQSNGLLYPDDEKESYGIDVTLTEKGILEIRSNIVSSEDYRKIWEKIAGQALSIESDMIRIITDNAPDSGPSCVSRNITTITNLLEKCCLAIQKQRATDPLPITARRSIKPRIGSMRDGNWNVMDINGFSRPGLAAAVVEVSMDLIECIPVVRGIWLAVDGGRIISANRAKRTLIRSVNQALGWAFTENIEYSDGVIPKIQYNNFKIFTPLKYPPIHIDFVKGDFTDPKGIGDLPFSCVPAAFMQAVSQAMDYPYKSIPLKRNDIWKIVRSGNNEASKPDNAQGKKSGAHQNPAGEKAQEIK